MNRSPAFIALQNLTVSYNRHPAVHHLSGRFEKGSLTAIVGPNGAGKSTLLRTIVGLLSPDEGEIVFSGWTKKEIAYLSQRSTIDRSFPINVLNLVLLGHFRRVGSFRGYSKEQIASAKQAISAVGLSGFEDRHLDSLSGGELQRAMFARIAVEDAPVIFLDEPFSAIDHKTCSDLLATIQGWHREGKTIVAVLHDLSQVSGHFSHTLLLSKEAVAWGETKTVLTENHIRKAWNLHIPTETSPEEICEVKTT
jgi:zinc/manganese transport system ATP-binding protein